MFIHATELDVKIWRRCGGNCSAASFTVTDLYMPVQVFMINLKRRVDRRERMLRTLYEQQIDCKVIEAVDGK